MLKLLFVVLPPPTYFLALKVDVGPAKRAFLLAAVFVGGAAEAVYRFVDIFKELDPLYLLALPQMGIGAAGIVVGLLVGLGLMAASAGIRKRFLPHHRS